jgi:hypothetical protein
MNNTRHQLSCAARRFRIRSQSLRRGPASHLGARCRRADCGSENPGRVVCRVGEAAARCAVMTRRSRRGLRMLSYRQLWRIVGFRRHLYEASHLRKPSSRACPESLTNWSLAPSCCSNALSSPCATPQSGAGLCAEVSRTLWCDICGGLQPIPRRGHLQTTNIGDLFIEMHHGRVGTASGQGW